MWRTQEDQFFHPLIFAILIICPILKLPSHVFHVGWATLCYCLTIFPTVHLFLVALEPLLQIAAILDITTFQGGGVLHLLS